MPSHAPKHSSAVSDLWAPEHEEGKAPESPLCYYKSHPLPSINYLGLWFERENFSLASLTCETAKCLTTIFKQYKSHQSAGWQASPLKEEGISIYRLHFCLGTTNCLHNRIKWPHHPRPHLPPVSLELLNQHFLSFLLAFCFREHIYEFTEGCILPCFTPARRVS